MIVATPSSTPSPNFPHKLYAARGPSLLGRGREAAAAAAGAAGARGRRVTWVSLSLRGGSLDTQPRRYVPQPRRELLRLACAHARHAGGPTKALHNKYSGPVGGQRKEQVVKEGGVARWSA